MTVLSVGQRWPRPADEGVQEDAMGPSREATDLWTYSPFSLFHFSESKRIAIMLGTVTCCFFNHLTAAALHAPYLRPTCSAGLISEESCVKSLRYFTGFQCPSLRLPLLTGIYEAAQALLQPEASRIRQLLKCA